MAASFPTTLPTIQRVNAKDRRNDPGKEGHALHNRLAEEVEALAAVIGVTDSVVPGTVEKRLSDASEQTQSMEISGKRFALSISSALSQSTGASAAIQIIGDSTGNSTTEWVWLLASLLAADYPSWTVKITNFTDARQDYGNPTVLQTGAAGDRYMDCSTGTYGRSLHVDSSAHLSGAIDIRVKMRMSDWTPAAQNTIAGKSGSSPNIGWYVFLTTDGHLSFAYSVNGTSVLSMSVSAPTGFPDGGDGWCRWVWTPDDGSGNKTLSTYKSTDGVTWTQLGSTTTSAGAVTQYNNSATPYSCGGTHGASVPPQVQRIYAIEIRDGVDGPIMAPVLPDLWSAFSSASAYSVGAPVLTIVNGSVTGASLAYLSDTTRIKKMSPDYGQEIIFLSCSHNDGLRHGRDYLVDYKDFIQSVETRFQGVSIVALTQNPQTSASDYAVAHAIRRRNVIAAAHSLGSGAIDIAAVFLTVAGWDSQWMLDSVHPNDNGQSAWASTIYNFIVAAKT